MNVMLWLIMASLTVAGGGLAVFMWSLRSGQYEDLKGASRRILFDDYAVGGCTHRLRSILLSR